MYLLFRDKNWKPHDYFSLPEGEKVVVRAFLSYEAKESEKIRKEMGR